MAEKNPAIGKNRQPDRLYWKLGMLLLILGALIAGGILLFFAVERVLFRGNERFTLRQVELHSKAPGYWDQHREQLNARLGLHVGRDNLFALDIGRLRGKLREIPAIESCEISRVLPDTLVISIAERIPRAALFNPRSQWVVDAEGVVMEEQQSMRIGRLPVISGIPLNTDIRAGAALETMKPALDLLMSTIRNYPDISVVYISCSKPGKLEFALRYRNGRHYRAIVPSDGRFNVLLLALQNAIVEAQHAGDGNTTFDLSFDGVAVSR